MIKPKNLLPKKSDNISEWYLSLISAAELADYGPVKGTMIIKPYAYAIWENIQEVLNGLFKKEGVQNAYFPLFIPQSFIQKEKKHIEGFSPELAVVTTAGGSKLDEPLIIRPTSETIMYDAFSKWISSYQDLPIKINQWANVVRWEKRTFPFIRTSEFLWQEGHTVHQTKDEAQNMTMQALGWYKKLYEDILGISCFAGEKSNSEKFAGAERTFSIELVLPDGKALQAGTSHNLGQNFSKSFDITYLDTKNKRQYPYQTSWGISTRLLGGMFMIHSDDHGLIIPPKIAPYQVAIIAIFSKNEELNKKILAYIKTITDILDRAQIRFCIDSDDKKTVGFRLNKSEIMGYPLRIEIGQNEYETKRATLFRRDTFAKESCIYNKLPDLIHLTLESIHETLLQRSLQQKQALTTSASSFDEFTKIITSGKKFIHAYWCESEICEQKIKEKTKATTRVVELDDLDQNNNEECIYCGNPARRKWLFAQAY